MKKKIDAEEINKNCESLNKKMEKVRRDYITKSINSIKSAAKIIINS